MDKAALFRLWAPQGDRWSPWVKPVPFAHFRESLDGEAPPVSEQVAWSWQSDIPAGTALIFDLPGAESVAAGVSLLGRGYRPVPIFASCPPDPETPREMIVPAAVQTNAIIHGLAFYGPTLAPWGGQFGPTPAFLLDSNRQSEGAVRTGEIFDNRSVLFESDFPSARTLREHGVERVLIIRDPGFPLGDDLRYALLPWVKAGLPIELADRAGAREPFPIPPTGFFRILAHRVRVFCTFRRSQTGGFGRFVPESTGG